MRCTAPRGAPSPGGSLAGATGSSPAGPFFLGSGFLPLTIAPITNATGTAAKTAYFTFVAGGIDVLGGTTPTS